MNLILTASKDKEKIKNEAEQYAATFTIEDFKKDAEGNIKGTFFGTMNLDNPPPDQKATAIKIFE